jgi:hypothetical protein
MVAGARFALVLALTACGSGPSVQTQFFSTVSDVHDPDILADLKSIASAPALQSKGGEDRETAEGALASCMIAVGTYVPPSQLALAAAVEDYQHQPAVEGCLVTDYNDAAFTRTCVRSDHSVVPASGCAGAVVSECLLSQNGDDTLSVPTWAVPCGLPCELSTPMPANLAALATKYQARCKAERETEVGARLDAEVGVNLATARQLRDANSASFGDSASEVDHSIDVLSRLGVAPASVQRDRDAANALRRGAYGTKAMSSLIALEPDVVRATKELRVADNELTTLRKLTSPSPADTARVHELEQTEAAVHATIDAVHARYGFAEIRAREQAYSSDPEVVQANGRLAEVTAMLRDFEDGGIPASCGSAIDASDHDAVTHWIAMCGRRPSERGADDAQRITALLAEQSTLTTQLAALRDRHDVHWPMSD